MSPNAQSLKVAFVGGPMYDYPYSQIPRFEAETSYKVDIAAKLIHPELNKHIASLYESGEGDYDLITTHSKYAPSQKQWLTSLNNLITNDELSSFLPSTINLMRIHGDLVQLPRNIDVKLLYYRTDLFNNKNEQDKFKHKYGYALKPPETWEQLKDIAEYFTRPPDLYGFVFPGRYSGLFGHFFELLTMASGVLLDKDLKPQFVNPAGEWALGLLRDLYAKSCPPELPNWHYDEVAQCFRDGRAAMTTDWPGSFATYKDSSLSKVADKFSVAIYPVGISGKRFVYAGGFSYAIPKSCKNIEGALALMRFLLSDEMQYEEAQRGAIPVKTNAQDRIKKDTVPDSMEAHRLEMLEKTVRDHMLVPPKFAKYPAVEDVLWMALQKGFMGKVSIHDALIEAAEEINNIMKL